MKKTIAFLVIGMMTLSACSAAGTPPPDDGNGAETPAETPADPKGVNEDAVKAFEDSLADGEDPFLHRERLSAIIAEESPETDDAVMTAYLAYLRDFQFYGLDAYREDMQTLQPYFESGTQNLSGESIPPGALKTFHDEMRTAGLKFLQVEGSVDAVVDYGIMKEYPDAFTSEMRAYGDFKAMNSEKNWASDGGLVISLDDLGLRIAEGENYLRKYPESPHKEDVLLDLRNYLTGFFGGLPNTSPVYEGTYSSEFLNAYKDFMAANPDTRTADVLKTYYSELEANGFIAPYDQNDPDSLRVFMEQTTYRVDEIVEGF